MLTLKLICAVLPARFLTNLSERYLNLSVLGGKSEYFILSPTEKGGRLGRLGLKSNQVQIQVLRSELARRGVPGFGLGKKLPEGNLVQVL